MRHRQSQQSARLQATQAALRQLIAAVEAQTIHVLDGTGNWDDVCGAIASARKALRA